MNAAVLGLIALLVLVGLLSLVGLAVHALSRPPGSPRVRAPDALKAFEPRGGRQRFGVRLFEAGALAALWVVASGVLALWVIAGPLGPVALLFLLSFTGLLLIATWWAWRRGVLRGSQQTHERPSILGPGRRRRGNA